MTFVRKLREPGEGPTSGGRLGAAARFSLPVAVLAYRPCRSRLLRCPCRARATRYEASLLLNLQADGLQR